MQGRILIIDGTATGRILCRAKLREGGFLPSIAADAASGLRHMRHETPHILILGLPLPDLSVSELLSLLRADPATRMVSVIALVPPEDDALRIEALSAGCDEVMGRSEHDILLAARIRSLLRFHATGRLVARAWGVPAALAMAEPAEDFIPPAEICLVANRPEDAARWRRSGLSQSRDRIVVLDRDGALARAGAPCKADVIVIDADLGRANGGLQMLAQMTSLPQYGRCALCVVIRDDDLTTASIAFDLGADEVLSDRMVAGELHLRLRSLQRRKRHADRMGTAMEDGLRLAMVDPLTGLYNRRYAQQRLEEICLRARPGGEDPPDMTRDFAIMVIDLDRFKTVNDRHGHAAGDAVLTEVAQCLSEHLRDTDLLARIGGEEFLIVLPQTRIAEALQIAERLREAIACHFITLPSGLRLATTVSIGLAMGHPALAQADGLGAMIEMADQALLSAKSAGRNLVTYAGLNAA